MTQSTTHPSTPRWQRRKEARPSEIVAAALDVFVERGFAAARVEEVARRAGVTKGTLYLYFDSKAALFKAVVRETIVAALARASATVDRHTGSAAELFAQLLHETWHVMGSARLSGLPKLVLSEARNFPEVAQFWYEEVVRPGHELFGRVLRRGIERGEFRRVDVKLAVRLALAPLLHALVWQHSLQHCVSEPFDMDKYVDMHIDTFLHGVSDAPASESQHA
jgi:AcrR family transcriptional regulator